MILKKVGRTSKFGAAHKAELKLLCILLYYVAFVIATLAVDSFLTSLTPRLYLNALLPYINCESFGLDTDTDCQPFLSMVQRNDIFNLSLALILLIGFLPVVVFLFSVDFKLFARQWTAALQKFRQEVSSLSPNT